MTSQHFGWSTNTSYSSDAFLSRVKDQGLNVMPFDKVSKALPEELILNPYEKPDFALTSNSDIARIFTYFRSAPESLAKKLDVSKGDLMLHQKLPENIASMRDCPVWIDDDIYDGANLYERVKTIEMQTDRYSQIQDISAKTGRDYELVVDEEPVGG